MAAVDRRRILLAELKPRIPGAKTFCTWNPADKGANVTLTNGNLTATGSGSGNNLVRGTISVSAGQWYWETRVAVLPTSGGFSMGAALGAEVLALTFLGTGLNSIGWRSFDGKIYFNNVASAGTVGTLAVNDVLCHWLDLDAGTYSARKNNGAWVTVAIPTGAWFPAVPPVTNAQIVANFGATAFAFTPPDGVYSGVYSVGASTVTTLYVGSEGFNTGAADTPASTHYMGRIAGDQDVDFEREAALDEWGNTILSHRGQLVVLNTDGGLDVWRDYDWRDAQCVLLSGFDGDSRAAFTTYATLRIDRTPDAIPTRRWVFTLVGPLAGAERALQPLVYPDTTPNVTLIGKPRPITIGSPLYCEANRLDTAEANRNYEVHDSFVAIGASSIKSIAQIYDKGDLFAGPNDPFSPHTPITSAGGGAFTTWAGSPAVPSGWAAITAFGATTNRFSNSTSQCRCQSDGQQITAMYYGTTALNAGYRYTLSFTVSAVTTAGILTFRISDPSREAGYRDFDVAISVTGVVNVTIDTTASSVLQICMFRGLLDVVIDSMSCTAVQIIDWTYYGSPRSGFTLANKPEGKVVCNPTGQVGITVTERIDAVLDHINDRFFAQVGYNLGFDPAEVAALKAAANYRVAEYITSPITFLQFLRALFASWGACPYERRDGSVGIFRLTEPPQSSAGLLVLDDSNVDGDPTISMDEAKGLSTALYGGRNHSPHTDGDIADSVSTELRAALQAEWTILRRGPMLPSGLPDISMAYSHAFFADPNPTMLQDVADVRAETFRRCTLWRPTRNFYQVPAILGATTADALEPGQAVRLVWPKYGLQAGKNLRVVGVQSSFFKRRVNLKLWG